MRRTVIDPETGDHLRGEAPAAARGHVLHRPDGLAVTLAGVRADGADVEAQTRGLLSYLRLVVCDDLGGELGDVTALTLHVDGDALDDEARAATRRVRRQAFEYPHYPATTVVGVSGLPDGVLVEMAAEAFLPDDGWETDVVAGVWGDDSGE
jgi:enamine deaminase RidA (YjgF/YER057c/UK114 family)